MKNVPFEFQNCDICKHKDENASIEPCKSCDISDDINKFEPDYDKICKWCYNPVAPGDNICAEHRESHTKHSWAGCMSGTVINAHEIAEKKARRERIATAIMAGMYANPAATANYLTEVAAKAVCGADTLIALLDEVKE